MTKKEKNDLSKFCKQICNDHYELLKDTDGNMSYTFNLYANGSYNGQYKKFMFYAELKLNKVLGLITAEEVENAYNMIMSSDEDNFYIAYQIIKHFLKERHKKFGAIMDYKGYDYARNNYTEEILNPEDFLTKLLNR
jgi:hypothetical protein